MHWAAGNGRGKAVMELEYQIDGKKRKSIPSRLLRTQLIDAPGNSDIPLV